MNRQKRERLKRLVVLTNIAKYTIGLIPLICITLKFIYKLFILSINMYISVSLYPERLRIQFDYFNRLRKGLR